MNTNIYAINVNQASHDSFDLIPSTYITDNMTLEIMMYHHLSNPCQFDAVF